MISRTTSSKLKSPIGDLGTDIVEEPIAGNDENEPFNTKQEEKEEMI